MKKFLLLITMIAGILIIFSGCFDLTGNTTSATNSSTSYSLANIIFDNQSGTDSYKCYIDNVYKGTVTGWEVNYSSSYLYVEVPNGYYTLKAIQENNINYHYENSINVTGEDVTWSFP